MTRAIKQDANLNHAWQMLVSVEKDLRAKGIRTLERMMIYCNENKY